MNYKKFISKITALCLAASVCPAALAASTVSSVGVLTASAEDRDSVLTTNNARRNNYDKKAAVVTSYLEENSDGTFTRVEYADGKVIVEKFSAAMGVTLSKNIDIDCELDIFGGCYLGKDSNFLVFAQNNTDEKDSVETFRVVKYSKDWERLGSASLIGANTTIPFRSGSLRMTELNGKLYVHTCHQMFKVDGVNHQGNMSFVVDEAKMEVEQSFTGILGEAVGYVSHSFNQYITNDGEYIYRLDHGDTFPRGLCITKASPDNITEVKWINAYPISGNQGDNNTGVSVGGLETSADNVNAAGNTVDMKNYDVSANRNIFLVVAPKDLSSSKTVMLTNHKAADGVTVSTPQLVKRDDNTFAVFWNEKKDGNEYLNYAVIDGSGKVLDTVTEIDGILSDCKPIVKSNGEVTWYTTDGSIFFMPSIPVFAGVPGVEVPDPVYGGAAYAEEYKKVLLEKSSSGATSITYYIADLDYDGSPEMILKSGTCEADYKVEIFTMMNNAATWLNEFSGGHTSLYRENSTGKIMAVWAHMGDVSVTLYEMKEGTFEESSKIDLTEKYDGETSIDSYLMHNGFELGYFDNTEIVSMDGEWKSFIHASANHQMVEAEGIDLSILNDFNGYADLGDVDDNLMVDASDASLILVEYSLLSTGKSGNFTAKQRLNADIDKNGLIDASDASSVLVYYSYVSTGGTEPMYAYVAKG